LTDCDQLQQALQEYADAKLTNDVTRFAGLMMGVDTPTCGVVVVAAGLARVEIPRTPMTPEHMLPIGSNTKPFVATRVLQLAEQGDLSLEDTLSSWWPDIPNADSITVRQLLNHTSGVPRLSGDLCSYSLLDPVHEWTTEEILACIDGLSPLSTPGEEFHYTNTNYVLLGSIVEKVTENPLHEEIRNSLLSPLGLDHTFTLFYEDPPGELARSYEWDSSWLDVTDHNGNYSSAYAYANIASNVRDLLVWVKARSTATLLQATTLDEMMDDCVDEGSEALITDNLLDDHYGLGVECAYETNAGEVYGHEGGTRTALSELWYSPSWDSSVVLQINHGVTDDDDYKWLYPIVSDLFAIVGRSPGIY